MDVYDVTIIGGGSAGLVLAVAGAKLGKKTALVEKHRIGWRLPLDGMCAFQSTPESGEGRELRQRC